MAQSNDSNIEWDNDIQWEDSIEWDDSPKNQDTLKQLGQSITGGALAAGDFIVGMVPSAISGLSSLGNLALGKGVDKSLEEGQALGHTIEEYTLPSKLLEKSGLDPEYGSSDNWAYKQANKPLEKAQELGNWIGEWTQEHGAPPSVAAITNALSQLGIIGGALHGVGKVGGALENKVSPPKPRIQIEEEAPNIEQKVPPEELNLSLEERAHRQLLDLGKKQKGTTVPQQRLLEEGVIDDASGNFINPKLQEEYNKTLSEVKQPEPIQQELPFSTTVEEIAARRGPDLFTDKTPEHPKGTYGKEGLSDPAIFSSKLKEITDTGDYKVALNHIKENGPNEFARETAKLLEGVKDQFTKLDVKSNLVIKDNATGELKAVRGSYETANDTLTLSKEYGAGDYQVVLHEGTHSTTSAILDAYANPRLREKLTIRQRMSARKLNEIYTEIKDRITTGDLASIGPNGKPHYGLKNVNEFIAEAFSSKSFQDFLKGITLRNSKITVWNKFVEAVRQAIGLPESSRNALANTLSVGADLIESSTAASRDLYFGSKQAESVVGDSINYSLKETKDKAEVVKNIPGLKKQGQSYDFQSYDWKDRTAALDAIKNSPDLKGEPSFYTKSLAPRGYLGAEILDNKAYHAGVSVIKGALDHFARRSDKQLFEQGGVYSDMTRGEKLLSPGKMDELTRQFMEAKGKSDYQWNLDPEQAKIKDKILTLNKQLWQEVLDTVGPEKAKKLPPQVDNYFPGIFEGPWIFQVRDTPTGRPLIWTSNNKWAAKARATILKKQGYSVGEVSKRPAVESVEFGRDNMVAEYQLMIEQMADADTAALRGRIEGSIAADAATSAGFSKHLKSWEGFKGNLGNNPFFSSSKNYYNAKEALKRYVEAHNQWMASQELSKFYKELGELKTTAPKARDYTQKYISDILGRGEGEAFVNHLMEGVEAIIGTAPNAQKKAMRWLANMTTSQMIGASMRAFTQNYFQYFDVVIPKMLQLTKNPVDIMTPMLTGQLAYFQVLLKHQGGEILNAFETILNIQERAPKGLLGESLNAKYKYAEDQGLIDLTLLENTPPFKRKLPNAIYKYGAGFITRSSEQAMRFASFSTLVDVLIADGVPKKLAYEQARQWVEAHATDYSHQAKPTILSNTGVIGESLGRLQTYSANQFGRYFDYIKYAARTKDPIPLTSMLTINLLLAGLSGIVGFDVIRSVINMISTMSDDPDKKNFDLLAYVAEKMPEWVTWGALSTTTDKGFTNAFSQPLIGDGSWSNRFPVISSQIEQGRSVVKTLTTDPRETPNFEWGRRASSLAPQVLQKTIADKLLTEDGKSISKFTGEPNYTYKPEDKWLGNVMPFGRMKNSTLMAAKRGEEQRFNQGRKDKLEAIKDLTLDIYDYGNSNPFKQKKLTKLRTEYTKDYYIDQDTLQQELNTLLEDSKLPNQLLKDIKDDINFKDIPKVKRALKYKNLQEKSD